MVEAHSKKITSFRIDEGVLNKLKVHAKDERITLNSLVDHILEDYTKWDMTATKAGWIVLTHDIVSALMNSLDDKTLLKIANEAADKMKDTELIMTGHEDINAFIEILRGRTRKSGFSLTESIEDGWTKFMVTPHMGRKWSFFAKSWHERVVEKLGYQCKTEFTDNTWTIWIKLRK